MKMSSVNTMSTRTRPVYQKLQNEMDETGMTGKSQDKAGTPWLKIWRGINCVMVAFFTLSAIVQINDPDPALWIPLYLSPAALSLALVVKPDLAENKVWQTLCTVDLAILLIMAVYTFTLLMEYLALENPLVHEEGRELAGLLIAVAWLSICRFNCFGSNSPAKGTANALLLIVCILGMVPFAFWSMCYFKGTENLAHCKDMFPGLLGSS